MVYTGLAKDVRHSQSKRFVTKLAAMSNTVITRINVAGTSKNIIKRRPRINAAFFSLMRRLFEAFITKQFKYLFSSILFLVFLAQC